MSDYSRLFQAARGRGQRPINWRLLGRPWNWSMFCKDCWRLRIRILGLFQGLYRIVRYPFSHG